MAASSSSDREPIKELHIMAPTFEQEMGEYLTGLRDYADEIEELRIDTLKDEDMHAVVFLAKHLKLKKLWIQIDKNSEEVVKEIIEFFHSQNLSFLNLFFVDIEVTKKTQRDICYAIMAQSFLTELYLGTYLGAPNHTIAHFFNFLNKGKEKGRHYMPRLTAMSVTVIDRMTMSLIGDYLLWILKTRNFEKLRLIVNNGVHPARIMEHYLTTPDLKHRLQKLDLVYFSPMPTSSRREKDEKEIEFEALVTLSQSSAIALKELKIHEKGEDEDAVYDFLSQIISARIRLAVLSIDMPAVLHFSEHRKKYLQKKRVMLVVNRTRAPSGRYIPDIEIKGLEEPDEKEQGLFDQLYTSPTASSSSPYSSSIASAALSHEEEVARIMSGYYTHHPNESDE